MMCGSCEGSRHQKTVIIKSGDRVAGLNPASFYSPGITIGYHREATVSLQYGRISGVGVTGDIHVRIGGLPKMQVATDNGHFNFILPFRSTALASVSSAGDFSQSFKTSQIDFLSNTEVSFYSGKAALIDPANITEFILIVKIVYS